MKFTHVLISCFAFFLVGSGLTKKIQKKVDKEIEKTYEVSSFSLENIVLNKEITTTLPSEFGSDNFFKIISNQTLLGYAYVANAPSKTPQFDYLILLDENLIVKKAKVLIYREEYGGEIGSKRWLKQFVGKTPKDEVRYQEDIVAIAGATISVRSMTNAINDMLKSFEIIQSKKAL
jgi:Na+-translocating ferredoxin:NAD+ oxidoreductase RnfG subunit